LIITLVLALSGKEFKQGAKIIVKVRVKFIRKGVNF
jgi:hypothetical protein